MRGTTVRMGLVLLSFCILWGGIAVNTATALEEKVSLEPVSGHHADFPCPADDKDMRKVCKKGKKSPYCKPGCMQCVLGCRANFEQCSDACPTEKGPERKACQETCKTQRKNCKQDCPYHKYVVECPEDDKEMRRLCKVGPNIPNCKPGCVECIKDCRTDFDTCAKTCSDKKKNNKKKCRLRCKAQRSSCKMNCPDKKL